VTDDQINAGLAAAAAREWEAYQKAAWQSYPAPPPQTQPRPQPYPYGPQYPYPYPPQPPARNNGLAIASLVLGITWIWCIGSVLAIIFGIVAHRQIRESNGTQTGGGMATAGIVLGWLGIAGLVLMMILIAVATSSPTTY